MNRKKTLECRVRGIVAGATILVATASAQESPPANVSADDIVAQCRFNPSARSGESTIRFTIENMSGEITKERTLVMFWQLTDDEDVFARQTIYVVAPPEFKFNAYLRWEPPASSNKPPDQWFYSTNNQRTTRIAGRDPEDLTWGLIGEDLKLMQWPDSTKAILRTEDQRLRHVYDIEIVPSDKASIYGRIVSRFERGAEWASCVHTRSEFFDRDGKLVKDMSTTWTSLDGQRARKAIVVTSTKSKTKTTYQFSNTVHNPELNDNVFTPRALAYATRYLRKEQLESAR